MPNLMKTVTKFIRLPENRYKVKILNKVMEGKPYIVVLKPRNNVKFKITGPLECKKAGCSLEGCTSAPYSMHCSPCGEYFFPDESSGELKSSYYVIDSIIDDPLAVVMFDAAEKEVIDYNELINKSIGV